MKFEVFKQNIVNLVIFVINTYIFKMFKNGLFDHLSSNTIFFGIYT